MARIGRLAALLFILAALTNGCGESGSGDAQDSGRAAVPEKTATNDEPGRPAIPPELPEAVEGVLVQPFFDAEATQTSLAVAPGELFELHICGTHPGYEMASAQWKLEVPEGINILGESKAFPYALTMGSYDELYVITYPCQTGGEMYAILKYNCMATEEFAGGEFKTVKAKSLRGHSKEPPFIGYVTCQEPREQVPAYNGSATVTRK